MIAIPVPGLKVPVVTGAPAPTTWLACCPVSEDPRPSMIANDGRRSRRAVFTGAVRAAPPLMRRTSDERLCCARSSSSSNGRPKASPTMSAMLTFSRSMVSQKSLGSKVVGLCGSTMVFPFPNAFIAIQCAAPCMNGAEGSTRMPPSREFSTMDSIDSYSTPVEIFRPPRAAG
ncbi:unannotated protein [freshwater metagenome]|uniref:Unannotated protein n=1 Tax=freshwater metagenome TaxID=449393 RepID=A0A6J6XNG6_9ZZZZ